VIVVNPLHHYYREAHLQHVIAQMHVLGPPTLRAHFDGEVWHAREGTHRLRACKVLGYIPRLVHVPWRKTKAALVRAQIAARCNAHYFNETAAGMNRLFDGQNAKDTVKK
jgi:hypothetical protein